ncbi:hypothetical protein FIU97_09895 [Roseivivax sp. THAF40]|uniref:DUF6902 family protein n=1 Tax=unclassified Roseivivax TaxID=2639302 RepID=UPI0012693497|nr:MULTISPECIES: hypothetical protein [unclassified Roseivivax]QFS83138.1 hypothetical protein FIV09_09910 [Roseivivax sp. THAF197b]QFT46882.1 hypothetical protein FIU97_09895 [Roseivivax sp. THAF40]
MSNVVKLNVPARMIDDEARYGALVANFARHRRAEDDVFWLKENAEVLNVFESTGIAPGQEALEALSGFYDTVASRLAFFPQYYRFILSIALDLEDLGLPGQTAEALCAQVSDEGLPEAELSDLQRLEARRLLARRGIVALPRDGGLETRLRDFAARSNTFAIPNKKAAYELTHIVFYLSEYGRRDPRLSEEAVTSLLFAGTIAFLDKNSDLLSEVAIALHYADVQIPQPWVEFLDAALVAMRVTGHADLHRPDDYHEYLVANWRSATLGGAGFAGPIYSGAMRFEAAPRRASPLRELSECLFLLGANRGGDWLQMRAVVADLLTPEARGMLEAAATAVPEHFEAFFARFARAEGRMSAGRGVK